jgi:hypothetical protein
MAFPSVYNFSYYRGDTFEFVARPKSPNGETFPLDGFTAIFTIANQRGASATQYTASATINTELDIVTCTINPSTGRSLTSGSYVYDVEITSTVPDPDIIYTLLTGTITVQDDVTGAV